MNPRIKNTLGVTASVALVCAAVFFAAGTFFAYKASRSVSGEANRSFVVTAQGSVRAEPDIARISLSVITEGNGALSELQDAHTEKSNAVLAFLKESGIPEEDIGTANYQITPRYGRGACGERLCPPSEIVGYRISHTLSVSVRDFSLIGTLLDGAVARGANAVSGPFFAIEDEDGLKAQARAEALEKAKEKARALAEAGGFRLGKILSIDEYASSPVRPYAIGAKGGGGPETAPGSREVSVSVSVRYEIK